MKKTIGGYTVIGEIGKGTFGDVYLCAHALLPKRLVAIKILSRIPRASRSAPRFTTLTS